MAYYKIVVADARTPRDGKFIEEVGNYDPFTKECKIKSERVTYWLGVGAQPTNVVKKLLKGKSFLTNSKTKTDKQANNSSPSI